ncbi:MAG: zinc-ribbon domain-containing protein [Pseudomonadota bacterium]|nr:zinc-ribbon domain-containing protein [Pseudomonadota bacterium]
MKIFDCPVCDQLTSFENVQCVRCGPALGYLPEIGC